jgi:cyclopropane fatty-acyl-phospholipid synthase-like methyltransferase
VARVLKPGGRVVLTDLTAPAGPSEAVMTSYASPRFYQDIIPALGLHLVELTDVSEHTAPTTARLTEQILRHREELEAELGASLEQIWHDTMPAGLTAGDIGCIVVVAAKPRPARAQSCP